MGVAKHLKRFPSGCNAHPDPCSLLLLSQWSVQYHGQHEAHPMFRMPRRPPVARHFYAARGGALRAAGAATPPGPVPSYTPARPVPSRPPGGGSPDRAWPTSIVTTRDPRAAHNRMRRGGSGAARLLTRGMGGY